MHAKDPAGNRVAYSTSFLSNQDAIAFAIKHTGSFKRSHGPWRRLDEPNWANPKTLIDLSAALRTSNFPIITAAFSIPAAAFAELPVFRNFYAHRNEDTATRVADIARRYAISPRLHPSDVLVARPAARPNNLASQYVTDIVNIVQLMA
jgi:hypothetical protein